MSDRALRGSRLGATSYESDANTAPAERQEISYLCPRGHRVVVPFSAEAEVPATWECRFCGREALREQAAPPEPKAGRPARTHWDMLLERRSIPELEELLTERLEVLRAQGGPESVQAPAAPRDGGAAPRPSRKSA
jgi:rubredoxin